MNAAKMYYLSGPMSGLPEFNYPAFTITAQSLRGKGYEILSPHEIRVPDPNVIMSWDWYMKRALAMLLEADAIILLPGWTESRGARREFDIAVDLKMNLYLYDRDEVVRFW